MRERLNVLEAELAEIRGAMKLGYQIEGESFVSASSVQLRNLMRNSENETLRKACLEGLRTIGQILHILA